MRCRYSSRSQVSSSRPSRFGAGARSPRVNVRDFYVLRFARIAPLLLSLLAVLSVLHSSPCGGFAVPADRGGYSARAVCCADVPPERLPKPGGVSARQLGCAVVSLGRGDVLSVLSVSLSSVRAGQGDCLLIACLRLGLLGPFARTVFSHGNPLWMNRSYLGGMDAIAMGCLTAILFARRTRVGLAALVLGAVGSRSWPSSLGFSCAIRSGAGMGYRTPRP